VNAPSPPDSAPNDSTDDTPQRLLSAVVDLTPDIVVVKDAQLGYRSVNAAFLRFTGRDEAAAAGRTDFDFFPPHEAERLRTDGRLALESGETITRELEMSGEHEKRRFNAVTSPLRLKGAAIDGVVVTLHDITPCRQVAESLRLHTDRYATVLATSPDGYWIVDSDGRLVEVNDAYCAMLGYTPEELIGLHITQLDATETPQEAAAHIRKVMDEGFERFETRHRRKDGALIDVEVSVSYWSATAQFVVFIRDLTSQHRAEAALRDSESRFESTFEYAAVGIAQVDLTGHWRRINHALCEIVGYPHEELSGLTFQDITHPDDLADDLESRRRLLTRETDIYRKEKRYIRKDGEVIWVSLTVTLARHSDGSPDYFITVVEDIRARKRAEEALRKFSRVIDQAASTVVITDADGIIEYVNPRFVETTGYSTEEAIGNRPNLLKSDHTSDDQCRELWRTITRGDDWHGEFLNRRKDGSTYWESAIISPIRDEHGRITHFAGIKEEITERKRAEAALRESELLLSEAQRIGNIGSWRWDFRNDRALWSAELYRIFGRDPAQPPANYDEVAHYFTPEGWDELARAVERAVNEGRPYELDVQMRRPDGSPGWLHAHGEPLYDEHGQIAELHGLMQDITERKRAEEEILRLNTHLEQRVAERTAELRAANSELDAFAYAVSHDLRAPLRTMSGFAQALIEDYGKHLEDGAVNYLNRIEAASRRMNNLIDGLLTLSRSSRGELRRDPINISHLAQRLLTELARGEPERDVETALEEGLWATGDGRMIEVVLRNLLGNAWKYTALTRTPAIRLFRKEDDGREWICVADNGAGFNPAHAEKLFQPFQRLHGEAEFAGTGIGLATVQRIVQRHGGQIRATGEPNRGATFCLSLPDGAPPERGETE